MSVNDNVIRFGLLENFLIVLNLFDSWRVSVVSKKDAWVVTSCNYPI
jgi:hypothetical protein